MPPLHHRSSDGSAPLVARIFVLVALALLPGHPLFGQQDVSPDLTDEGLMRFATVHVAVTEARERHQGELARMHDTQGKERLREAFAEELAGLLAEHEMTDAEFESYTVVISVDPDARARFEEILTRIGTAPPARAAPGRHSSGL